ncbi:MAG: hypothetical protein AAF799_32040 [Myxococcota bacterium]
MRVIAIVGAILYGVVGISLGLAQQRSGLAPGEVDCPYRVRLIRDRVVALTQRSPSFRDGDPQDDVVLNLIRETQAACTADAASMQTLEKIEAQLQAHVEHGALESEIRRELLAL